MTRDEAAEAIVAELRKPGGGGDVTLLDVQHYTGMLGIVVPEMDYPSQKLVIRDLTERVGDLLETRGMHRRSLALTVFTLGQARGMWLNFGSTFEDHLPPRWWAE